MPVQIRFGKRLCPSTSGIYGSVLYLISDNISGAVCVALNNALLNMPSQPSQPKLPGYKRRICTINAYRKIHVALRKSFK